MVVQAEPKPYNRVNRFMNVKIVAVDVALPEIAVMVTCPTPPVPVVVLQLIKTLSHCPAQINPPVETLAILLLLLEKVMSAATTVPAEFSAVTDSVPTLPSFKEKVVGERISWETFVLAVLLPPHASITERPNTAVTAAKNGR